MSSPPSLSGFIRISGNPSGPASRLPPVPAPKEPLPASRTDEAPAPCKPWTAPLTDRSLDPGVAVLQQAPPLPVPRKSFPSSSSPQNCQFLPIDSLLIAGFEVQQTHNGPPCHHRRGDALAPLDRQRTLCSAEPAIPRGGDARRQEGGQRALRSPSPRSHQDAGLRFPRRRRLPLGPKRPPAKQLAVPRHARGQGRRQLDTDLPPCPASRHRKLLPGHGLGAQGVGGQEGCDRSRWQRARWSVVPGLLPSPFHCFPTGRGARDRWCGLSSPKGRPETPAPRSHPAFRLGAQ